MKEVSVLAGSVAIWLGAKSITSLGYAYLCAPSLPVTVLHQNRNLFRARP